jgi:uncharacterized membrane protein
MAATFESFKPHWPVTLEFPRAGGVPTLSRSFTWSLRILCCVALGVTGYLALTALRSEDVAGCSSGAVFDCSFVLHSRWSKFLGLPVSVPAFALYAVVMTALILCRPAATRSLLHMAWGVVTVGAISAGLAALWFLSLQVFAVGHLCTYCIAAHLCGLALCIAVLWKRPLGGRMTANLTGIAVLGVATLIGTQVLSAPPQTFKVEHYPSQPTASSAPAATKSDTQAKPQQTAKAQVFEPPAGIPDDDK